VSTRRPRPLYVAEPAPRYGALPPLVVDCSVLSAVLFDEPERDQAAQRMAGHALHAPQLLDHELVNVAIKKQRRGLAAEVVARALADFAVQDITLQRTDLSDQFALAQRYELTAYDAAYLWLAAHLAAPLATFDERLARAAQQHLKSQP
jgi:predicted nucleic acid-binding protein